MTRSQEIIAAAEKKAERSLDQAKREAAIVTTLLDHPAGEPERVTFQKEEVWICYPSPPVHRIPHKERPTVGAYWAEAVRVLESFDWQTIAQWSDTFTHTEPEERVPEKEPDNLLTFDGPRLVLEGGKGWGPDLKLIIWTELPPHLNEGFFRVTYEIPRDILSARLWPVPRHEYNRSGARVFAGMDSPELLRRWCSKEIKHWVGDLQTYHREFLFSGPDWEALCSEMARELGD